MYGGVEIYLHGFLTLVHDRGEWLPLRSGRFTAVGRSTVIHWLVWMASGADLDIVTKREGERYQCSRRVVQPVAWPLY
jgi:hypothetical protein